MNLAKNFASSRKYWRNSRQDRARFWPPGICFSKFAFGISTTFGPHGVLLPGENLGEIRGRIWATFSRSGISLPGEHLAGIRPGFPPGLKSRRPTSRRNPGGIPADIAAGSRQDSGPCFTGVQLSHYNPIICELQSSHYNPIICRLKSSHYNSIICGLKSSHSKSNNLWITIISLQSNNFWVTIISFTFQ